MIKQTRANIGKSQTQIVSNNLNMPKIGSPRPEEMSMTLWGMQEEWGLNLLG
jgi:hypothetical protein